ncbi:MAG: site-specific integrase, partial [Firmicutes bacterium]|nr:site-specific integrase [Bacillota bacterium]
TAWRHEQQGAERTVQRRIRTLRSLYRFGQARAHWPHNPFLTMADPLVADQGLPLLTDSEIRRFLQVAQETDRQTYTVASLVLSTGLRLDEIRHARWKDIGLTPEGILALIITVPHHAARAVKIRPDVFSVLARWRMVWGWPTDLNEMDDRPLFPALRHPDRPIRPATLSEGVQTVAARAGLNHKVTLRTLRHAHAGQALLHGATLPQIQAALGYTTIQSALRYDRWTRGLRDTTADHVPFTFGTS